MELHDSSQKELFSFFHQAAGSEQQWIRSFESLYLEEGLRELECCSYSKQLFLDVLVEIEYLAHEIFELEA